MTESEAIKRCEMLIKGFSVNHATYEAFAEDGKGYPTFNTMKEFAEACKYALEEVEQYRAIGTVEELQKMKADYAEAIIDWRQYKKIGTIERFRELTEKAEPKKPIYGEFDENELEEIIPYKATCPICGFEFEFGTWNDEENHHCECGQRMNWEREEQR